MLHTFLLAQASPGASIPWPLILGMLAIFYFLLIRPQQKQAKEQQTMLAALKKGDDVVTTGGMLGKIFLVADKVITLEVQSGVKVRVLKSAITGRVIDEKPAEKNEKSDKSEKSDDDKKEEK